MDVRLTDQFVGLLQAPIPPMPSVLPEITDSAEKFRVVLLYDRFQAAGRALATYTHLAHELEREFKPDLRVWRMDIAASAAFAERANDDIAAAELIIVAVSGNEPCPAAFRHWQGGAVPGGSASPHGIIALVGAKAGAGRVEGTWNSVLQDGATQIHPDVFVYEPATETTAALPAGCTGTIRSTASIFPRANHPPSGGTECTLPSTP